MEIMKKHRYKIIYAATFITIMLIIATGFLAYTDFIDRKIKDPTTINNDLYFIVRYHAGLIEHSNSLDEALVLLEPIAESYGLALSDSGGTIVHSTVGRFTKGNNLVSQLVDFYSGSTEVLNSKIFSDDGGALPFKDGRVGFYMHFLPIKITGETYYLYALMDDMRLATMVDSILIEAVLLFVISVVLILTVSVVFIVRVNRKNILFGDLNEKLHYLKEQYDIALSHSNHLMFNFDMSARMIIFPGNAGKLFKIPDIIYEVPNDNLLSKLVYEDDLPKYIELFERVLLGEEFAEAELRIRNIAGTYVWNNVSIQIIRDLKGKPVKAVGFMEDITDYINAKIEAENEAIVKKTLFSMYKHGFEINITRDRFISGEKEICEVSGLTAPIAFSELVNVIIERKINREDAEKIKFMYSVPYLQQCYEKKKNILLELEWASRSRGLIWLAVMVSIYKNADGDFLGLFLVSDIDEVKKESLKLIDKARFDSATGLYNKASTEEQIKKIIFESRGTNRIHALIMIDIDKLKTINDCLGHLVGDERITDLATLIKKTVRSTDIAGRVGGDEFILFFKDVRDKTSVTKRIEELLSKYKTLIDNSEIAHSFSAGVSFYKNSLSFEEFYNSSDIALYQSKNRGGSCYTVYNETMGKKDSYMPFDYANERD